MMADAEQGGPMSGRLHECMFVSFCGIAGRRCLAKEIKVQLMR